MINWFQEAVAKVKYDIEYGFHCNDLNHGEIEDDLIFIFDKLAKENGMPAINWENEDAETVDLDN